jgi:GTP-binding protein
MINWCAYRNLPCAVVLTKADKLKRGPAQATLLQVQKSLPPVARALTFSSTKGQGKTELIKVLNSWYELGEENRQDHPGEDPDSLKPAAHDIIDSEHSAKRS